MLVGRQAERARLEELLVTTEASPVACVIDGAPGIGKTTLWRESVEGARGRGYLVLETAPSEPEAVLAFSGLGDLFERIPDKVLESLPETQAQALKAALSVSELPESVRDGQALPRAILHVLRELSAAGRVLVAIDDEQWLDPGSARVLAFALCRLREEPLVVMMARRSEPGGTLSRELGRRFGGRGLERILLEPMPMGEIKLLLTAQLGRTIPVPVLRRIHQGSGGNPLWALAIALELGARSDGGDRAVDLPIPPTLSDAIELRLKLVDPRADAALLAIAMLSQATPAMLQAAIPEFALSDLESAEQAGVIETTGGRLRFTHPVLASTHYANTPAGRRREFHRLLATVIDDEEERAQHVALGAEAPDRELADSLECAAGVAARRGAPESAAQLLEDSARLTPIDQIETQCARLVASAEHRFTSGEASRASDMLSDVMRRLGRGPLRARARLALALISADRPVIAMELLQAALPDAETDDRLRVEIDWELCTAAHQIGRLASARIHAESALRTAERLDDAELVAMALGVLVLTLIVTGEPLDEEALTRLFTLDALPAIDASARWTTYCQPATKIGLALHWAGDGERARGPLERAAQRALSRDEEWDRWGIEFALAQLEWEMGNRRAAEQHREAVEATGEFAEAHVWLLGLDAVFALETGDLATARAKVEQGIELAEHTGAAWQTARFMGLLAEIELLSGQPEIAHSHLKEYREWLQSNDFGPAGYGKTQIWSLDVEALIALDRLEEAEEVLAQLWARVRLCKSDALNAIAARCEGMLLTARGDLSAAIEAMDDAIAAHLRRRRPFEHGRTLVELGSVQRRAKHKAQAKETLEQALGVLEPLGARIWVARARDELSRIGLRRAKATEGLTPAQTRVAELVAAGSTNVEIARELHMSRRTVQTHLSRVYQEHGVTSRSQLIAALASSPGAASQS